MQALIVVSIVEIEIVLLATHIQKETPWRTQQVTLLKLDLRFGRLTELKAKTALIEPKGHFELVTNLYCRLLWEKRHLVIFKYI